MSEEEQLREALHAILDRPVSPAIDRGDRVNSRVRRIRMQRIAATAVSAVVVLSGAGAVIVQTRSHGSSSPTQVLSGEGRQLSLALHVAEPATVGTPTNLLVVLSGLADSPDRYGWNVTWGDGGRDRAYGAAQCRTAAPVATAGERSYSHTYTRPGTYTITVTTSLCGRPTATATATVTVGPTR